VNPTFKSRWLFLLIGMIALVSLSSCQREVEEKVAFKIDELICPDGQHLVEGKLLGFQGIRAVVVNLDTREVTVRFRTSLVTGEELRQTLLATGFTVDSVSGDPNARKRLPSCCLAND